MFFKRTVVALVSCLLIGGIIVAAQPKPEEVNFSEGAAYLSLTRESITAKKGEATDIFAQPNNITVITREEIEKLNPSTVVDVLCYQNNLFIRDWTGAGKTVDADLGGFGETGPSNVLVLVNGRRVNNIDISNVDWTQIPLSAIEKIEIIRGPSAVLYGDNATAGVINIITKKDITGLKLTAGLEAGSFETIKMNFGISDIKDKLSYNIVANRNSTSGFRQNSGITNTDVNAFVNYDLVKAKLSIDTGYHLDQYGMPGSVTEAQWESNNLKVAETPNDHAKTNDAYGQIAIETPVTEKLKNEFTISTRERLVNSYWRSWFMGEARKTNILGVSDKVTFERPEIGSIIGGIETYFASQNIKNLDKDDNPVPGETNLKKNSLAVYITDDIKLLNQKLYISPGARYELTDFSIASTGTNEVKLSSAAQAYSLGVSYLVNEKTSIYTRWAQAFRLPKVDEYYSAWAGFNPALQNQLTATTELGLKKILNEKIAGDISLFMIDTENEIFLNPATFNNENYPKTHRLGGSLGLNLQPLKILNVQANYTYTDAKITEGDYKDSTVPAVPAHKASLINNLEIDKFNINLAANYVGERYFISDQKNVSKKMDAYLTMDLKLSYKVHNLQVFAGINNLLDTKYAEYGVTNLSGTTRNYYPSPERNFTGGIKVSF